MSPQPQPASSSAPVQKVVAGALAGALSTIVVFVLDSYVLPVGKQLTGEVAAAITTVFTFAVSYLVPPAGTGR